MSSELVIDKGFRPVIDKGLASGRQRFLELWKMGKRGVPVRSLPGIRSALWHGGVVNPVGELPVLVCAVERTSGPVDITEAAFYFGVVHQKVIRANRDLYEELASHAVNPCLPVVPPNSSESNLDFVLHVIENYTQSPEPDAPSVRFG